MFQSDVENKLRHPDLVITGKKLTHSRYFVELQVSVPDDAPRILTDIKRRHTALEFVCALREWLHDQELTEDVSSLCLTAMGQVMIMCSHQVMDLIRAQDIWAIATIRSAETISDLQRVSEKI